MNRSIIVSLVASALLVFLSSSLVFAASPPLRWLSLSDHVSPLLLRRGISPAAVSAHLSLAAPVARSDFAFGYDARRSRLIVFGGKSQESGEVLNDIWSFSLLSLQWTEHRTDSMQMRPPSRFSMVSGVSVSDPNPLTAGVGDDDRFFISTGEGSSGEHFNDLWSFHLRTHIWQQHEISGEQWRKRYGASGGIPISYAFNNNTDIAICSNSSSLSMNSTAAGCSLEFVSPVDSLTSTEAQSFVLTHGFSSDRYQDTFRVQLSPLHFAGSESTSPPVSLPSFSASVGSVPFSRCLHAGAISANGRMALFGGCGSRGHGPCPAYDAHIWHTQSQEWTQADRCPGPRLYASMSIWPDQFQPAQLSSSSSSSSSSVASPTFVESGLLFGGTGRIFSSGFPGEVNLLDLTSGQWRRLAPVGLRRATMPDGSADFDTPPIQSDDALPPITAHHQTVMVYQPPTELLQLLGIDPSAAGVMTSTDGNSSITAPPALLFAMGGDLGSEIFLLGGSSSATRLVGCPSVFPLRMFHGLVMFLGWGVFIPLAVLFARYGKAIDVLPEPIARYTSAPFALTQLSPCCRRPHQRQQEGKAAAPALWFQLHRLLNSVGLLLIVGGFISAILMVPIHPFTLPHHFLGVIAVAFGLLQPLNAFLRPHPPSGGETKSRSRVVWEHLHRWSGRVGLTLALVNIFLGLAVIHAHVGFSIGFAIYLVALALLVLLLERRLRRSTKLEDETAAGKGLLADGSGAANAKSSNFNSSAAAAASGENDLGATGTSGVAPGALVLSERHSNSTRILVGSEGAVGLRDHPSHDAMENGTTVSTTTSTDSVIEMLNRS